MQNSLFFLTYSLINYIFNLVRVYNWYNLFKLGYESTEDNDKLSRPYDEQLAITIDHILKEEWYSSIRYIAHKISSNPATVYRYITIYLQRVYRYSKYVPHLLDEIQKAKRVNECNLLLNILCESEELGFINIFTGDESWFYIKFNLKGAWILPDEKVPFFENTGFQMRKFMLTVIWGENGINVIDIMDSSLSLNSEYFITRILCQIEQIKIQKNRYRKKINYYLKKKKYGGTW